VVHPAGGTGAPSLAFTGRASSLSQIYHLLLLMYFCSDAFVGSFAVVEQRQFTKLSLDDTVEDEHISSGELRSLLIFFIPHYFSPYFHISQ
jgi:hypothetical protein